jgi:hypothetical protein
MPLVTLLGFTWPVVTRMSWTFMLPLNVRAKIIVLAKKVCGDLGKPIEGRPSVSSCRI